jgi:predicted XRE-type DNA-binding protein
MVARTEKNMKKTMHEEEITENKVEIGSGSVYADLGFKNHEEMETKSNLVMEISKVIKKKKLTQTQAAEIFAISQPKLSELLNGRFRGYSIERLIHFLNEIGQDVDIIVKSKPRNRKARVAVFHSHSHTQTRSSISMVAKARNS